MAVSYIPADAASMRHIAAHLRPGDRRELAYTSPGKAPVKILMDGMRKSRWATVVCIDDEPVLVYGVAPTEKFGVGAPWMLATTRFRELRREIVRNCRGEADLMQQSFGLLVNVVHRSNTAAQRLLEWNGFTILRDKPVGELFVFFRGAPGHV